MASGEELITAAALIVGNRYPIDSAEWDFEVEQVAMRLAFRGRVFQRFVDDLAKNAEKVSPVKRWGRITAVTKAKTKDGRSLDKATVHYEVPKKDGPADTYRLDTAFFSQPGARQLARRCQELRGRMVYLYQWYEENTDRKTVDTGNGSVTPSAFSILVGVEAIPDENEPAATPPAPQEQPPVRHVAPGDARLSLVPAAEAPGAPAPPPPPEEPDVPATPPVELRQEAYATDMAPTVNGATLKTFKDRFQALGTAQGQFRELAKTKLQIKSLLNPTDHQLVQLLALLDQFAKTPVDA